MRFDTRNVRSLYRAGSLKTVTKEISKHNVTFLGMLLQTGYGLVNGFIDYLYTALGTTRNYSTIVNLHSSKITTASATPSPACCLQQPFPATASNSGDSSASRAHVVTVRRITRNYTHSTDLGSSIYSLGADTTENKASNKPSILVMGGCRKIARVSFPQERVYEAVAQKRPFVYPPVA
jgi:hypothetical protein